ncbi:MAG: TonB-dependent receptor [Candidatus Binatia bacterium]
MDETPLDSHQKALRINLDRAVVGTFAEIGAGQEVARWFFHVGGASGTVAKTISAYDMAVSDAVYGPTQRYVSRQRLEAMLEHEYALLLDRLGPTRGDQCRFFVFADSVATRNPARQEAGHGWLGVRFLTVPRGAPSEIIIHVVTHDRECAREQAALGAVGVNLLYGAAYHSAEPATLLASLMDNLTRDRLEIDMIKFTGPAFAGIDNRLMSLELVERGFTDATMFTAAGDVVQPAEMLYKRAILVERGRFRPVTLLTQDLLERARAQFIAEHDGRAEPPVVLMEMTLRGLGSDVGVDRRDFLARAETLRALGQLALISNHGPYYRLVQHLSRYTQQPIGIALGVPALMRVLDPQHYQDLPGRTLEAVGRLFAHNVRVYLYPHRDPVTGDLITAETLRVAPPVRHLYAHLLANCHVQPIRDYTARYLPIYTHDVLRRIQSNDPSWEGMVPAGIVEVIKSQRLFGWHGP